MKYKIVEESWISDLTIEVNKNIENGWLPIGGVAIDSSYGSCQQYAQAMILEESEDGNN